MIGNPPYVKLQNFVKVNADMAAWLVSGSSGEAPYRSTGTGNFDLYLPFIEKGLSLLNDTGRMGYIAPNLWPTLEYGEGLRAVVHAGRHLEKWLDFRSFQVFEEATVYTAIQIFSKAPVAAMALAFAGDGDISRVDWTDPDNRLPYDEVTAPLAPWLIAPAPVRTMIARLGRETNPLGSSMSSEGIMVGVQATINDIYHLSRKSANRYLRHPKQIKGRPKRPDELVEVEDNVMRPLVSGPDVHRFIVPEFETYLLWPYREVDGRTVVIPEDEMKRDFPKAYRYLSRFRDELSAANIKNISQPWYRYTYPKNLGIQHAPKIIAAQTVTRLRMVFDARGSFWLDNVRANGIRPKGDNGWFLLGVLNSPLINMIFTWLGKPKDNGFYEANKQFIAPLPIPRADRTGRAALSALARGMQERHTEQVRRRAQLDERLASTARVTWPLERLLPDVRAVAAIEAAAPAALPPAERKAWVDDQRRADEEAAHAGLDALLRPEAALAVRLADGKLSLLIDDREAARVFVGEGEAALVEAQWRAVTIGFEARGRKDGERLVKLLRRVATAAEPAVLAQILTIADRLAELDAVLRDDERDLHELTCTLFGLTPEERRLVEAGR